jgi:hypothetical protein
MSQPILTSWYEDLVILNRGHWEAARGYEAKSFWLGVVSAFSAAVAGTTAFANASNGGRMASQIVIGCFSVLAAVISFVAASYKSSDPAQRHKAAAVAYGRVRRKVEEKILETGGSDASVSQAWADELCKEWNAVDAETPPVPQHVFRKVKSEVRSGGPALVHTYMRTVVAPGT